MNHGSGLVWELKRAWVKFLEFIVDELDHLEKWIERDFFKPVVSFQINQTGECLMSQVQGALIGIVAGATGTFSATPIDSLGNPTALPAGITPIWASSDPTNAPVTATVDGLSATVSTNLAAPVGTPFTLTISATLADGAVPTSGPVPVPVLPSVPLAVASFVITQVN